MTADQTTAAPVTRTPTSASTAADHAYPHGHMGELTAQQQEAFVSFKELIREKGMLKPSHDDPTILRYLRARRWVVQDAFQQFKDTEDWRVATDIETLYDTIDLDAYEQSRRLYPQWTGRRDRRGIPLYVYEIRTLDSKTVTEYEKKGANTTFSQAKSDGKTPPGLLRLFALYENLTRFAMPLCTQLKDRQFPEVPISMSTNIVDISGVGLKQFWNLKAHMQAASQLATAHYPETLDRIFIIGAPMFFGTVWGWVKRWFDPITVSKIFVLNGNEVKSTLESFIEPRNIPKKYGGELDYNFGGLPVTDPAWDGVLEWENGHKSFPTGPMVWEEVDGGKRLACIGLGSVNGQVRRETICTIPNTFGALPQEEVQPAQPQTNDVAVPAAATETSGPDVSEGTQTAEVVSKDDSVQTDDTLLSDEVNEKLKINDGAAKTEAVEAAPVAKTSVA